MRLRDIIRNITPREVVGSTDIEISALSYDSRTINRGDCFFAVEGVAVDGHRFITSAIERGAVAVVCHRLPETISERVTYIVVEDSQLAMGFIASAFYGEPSRELQLVGVTGTNGKTTTATLLYDLFRMAGYESGLISTVVYRIGDEQIESTHTTPDAIRLNEMMRRMVDSGCRYCFMEVSSHSIAQHRIAGLNFAGAIFSNITHEHLDYHKTFSEYIRVKKSLFDSLPKGAFALTNIDDRNGEVMVQNTRAKVYTMSLRSGADFRCKVIEMLLDGMLLRFGNDEVWVKFLGRFNASNLLAVFGAATLLGLERGELLRMMSALSSVAGRFEYTRAEDGTTAIVDYAHTPDALENVIQTIEEIRTPNQQLIVLCGCGGDRDRTKRPEMARIAARYASISIFTSDNPRHEPAEAILDEMERGVTSADRYLKIVDRGEAIKTAVMLAKAGDIILIAGKGHETYQIVGDQKHHFDDREQVAAAFAQRKK